MVKSKMGDKNIAQQALAELDKVNRDKTVWLPTAPSSISALVTRKKRFAGWNRATPTATARISAGSMLSRCSIHSAANTRITKCWSKKSLRQNQKLKTVNLLYRTE